ncbi:DNA polymerase-3 subunit epsilon [Modicisalibacter xianhensis]|uniref:DNA polymerase-3 subunit epsilon n=1 Tax=Modicisalibacter xianhensis TaxID=442341 RepID=A0A4R8FPP7_9GAMM|nr:3'-5' exonuclease [Halomonas xianhensis]TDX28422.1 DNA polymerase-3 subunit epsilon [Halomonas xianhensis]
MLSFRLDNSQQRSWPDYLAERAAVAHDPRLQRFFSTGCPAPDTPIGEAPLLALDMETTGLDANRHAIVSIGLVPFTLQRISPRASRYWVLKPPRPLTESSIAYHHITHSETDHAPDLSDIIDELLEAMAGRLVVAHYYRLERSFLNSAFEARVGEGLRFPMLDTMVLEAKRYRHSWRARLASWVGKTPASIRLQDSRDRYGLPAYTSHHALTDALATAELLQAQIAYHHSPQTPIGSLWV